MYKMRWGSFVSTEFVFGEFEPRSTAGRSKHGVCWRPPAVGVAREGARDDRRERGWKLKGIVNVGDCQKGVCRCSLQRNNPRRIELCWLWPPLDYCRLLFWWSALPRFPAFFTRKVRAQYLREVRRLQLRRSRLVALHGVQLLNDTSARTLLGTEGEISIHISVFSVTIFAGIEGFETPHAQQPVQIQHGTVNSQLTPRQRFLLALHSIPSSFSFPVILIHIIYQYGMSTSKWPWPPWTAITWMLPRQEVDTIKCTAFHRRAREDELLYSKGVRRCIAFSCLCLDCCLWTSQHQQ